MICLPLRVKSLVEVCFCWRTLLLVAVVAVRVNPNRKGSAALSNMVGEGRGLVKIFNYLLAKPRGLSKL